MARCHNVQPPRGTLREPSALAPDLGLLSRAKQAVPEHRVWVLVRVVAAASSDPEASPSETRTAGAHADRGNTVFKYWR